MTDWPKNSENSFGFPDAVDSYLLPRQILKDPEITTIHPLLLVCLRCSGVLSSKFLVCTIENGRKS
jgi:hypothetical protein